MSIDYLRLKGGVTHWLDDTVSDNLKYSVIDFYKWAFLETGGYQNITRSPAISGVYGGSRYRLGYTDEPRFTAGTVWQGFRSDWVYETGVSFTPPPTSVNVYVNSSLIPENSGYYVDYPRGRVVFSTPRSSGTLVEANFTHRTVSFVNATEPWFRELMFDSYDVSRDDFLNSSAGGKWGHLGETRMQMPVVGVEVAGTPRFKPYELGAGNQWIYQDLLFYIYSENESQRNKLRDIIAGQNDRAIWLYNRALMKESPNWPFFLDSRGTPISGFYTYPSLVSDDSPFRWTNTMFRNTQAQNMDLNSDWLWGAVVRTTAEMITVHG